MSGVQRMHSWQGREHSWAWRRIVVHAEERAKNWGGGVADTNWRLRFCISSRGVGVFRSGHTLAALLSSVDVPRSDGAGAEAEPLGIFHRDFRGGPLGLREHCCDEFLLGWPAAARGMDSLGSCGQARFADCGSRLVLQFTADYRLRVGVLTTEGEIRRRYRSIRNLLCAYYGILCWGYGDFSAKIHGDFSRTVASAPAVVSNKNLSN